MAKNECILAVYDDLIKSSNEKLANIVCDNIELDILINFILLQIKCRYALFGRHKPIYTEKKNTISDIFNYYFNRNVVITKLT